MFSQPKGKAVTPRRSFSASLPFCCLWAAAVEGGQIPEDAVAFSRQRLVGRSAGDRDQLPRQSRAPRRSQPLPGAAPAMLSPCSCCGQLPALPAPRLRGGGTEAGDGGSPGAGGSLRRGGSQPRATAPCQQDLLRGREAHARCPAAEEADAMCREDGGDYRPNPAPSPALRWQPLPPTRTQPCEQRSDPPAEEQPKGGCPG